MITSASARRLLAGSSWPLAGLFALSLGIGVVIAFIAGVPSDKEIAACDEAVHQVLTTKDPIELRRNIFLVRYLNCRVSSRL
jgi:hypothetical protein